MDRDFVPRRVTYDVAIGDNERPARSAAADEYSGAGFFNVAAAFDMFTLNMNNRRSRSSGDSSQQLTAANQRGGRVRALVLTGSRISDNRFRKETAVEDGGEECTSKKSGCAKE